MTERGALPKTQAKILVLGESGVGKTALSQIYTGKTYQSGYQATLGVEFSLKAEMMAAGEVWQ